MLSADSLQSPSMFQNLFIRSEAVKSRQSLVHFFQIFLAECDMPVECSHSHVGGRADAEYFLLALQKRGPLKGSGIPKYLPRVIDKGTSAWN